MNDAASEYLPGADKKKAFTIAPAEQDWSLVILQARRDALEDSELTHGAKMLFVYLLDLSLQRGSQRWFGAVLISVNQLCNRLHCGVRSIYQWNVELTAKRFVWISHHKMPNAWPMNIYHITALDPKEEGRQMPTQDGIWGNGARRSASPPGPGARKSKPVQKLHAENKGGNGAFPPISSETAHGSGEKEHTPHAEIATASSNNCGSQSQKLRLPIAENATGSRKKVHLAVAKNSTPPPQKTADLNRSIDSRNQPLEGKGKGEEATPPTEKALKKTLSSFEGWKKRTSDLFPSKLEKLRADLAAERDRIKADKASFDLAGSELKPAKAEWIGFARREIEKNGPMAKDRKRQVAEILADPASYISINLTEDAKARLEMVQAKLSWVQECLSGPEK